MIHGDPYCITLIATQADNIIADLSQVKRDMVPAIVPAKSDHTASANRWGLYAPISPRADNSRVCRGEPNLFDTPIYECRAPVCFIRKGRIFCQIRAPNVFKDSGIMLITRDFADTKFRERDR